MDETIVSKTERVFIDLPNEIDGRGAKIKACNVLRELSVVYELAIGLEYFDDSFTHQWRANLEQDAS